MSEEYVHLENDGKILLVDENGEGPKIGLRADMDALPITEANQCDHISQNEGVMHACGHDGHTTMLLGAARYLSETRNFKGEVIFCLLYTSDAADD